jgi:hypothetical protein
MPGMAFASASRSEHMKPVFVLILVSCINGVVWRASGQTEYAVDGAPTGLEEEIRWRVNRGRFDSASENQARGTAYTDVPATAGPLAPNQSLTLAARHHSEDMAKHNVFQHATVPGSGYYNATTQPQPWDRMTAEGYTWNGAAENIAAGYSGAEAVYLGWWGSTGHRVNMYNSNLREIGNGYYYWSSSTYGRYYTMDLGSSGNARFFTDTLFYDANANGIYEPAEAVAAVRISLRVGGTNHTSFDVSSSAGSFAIPIQSISGGSTVQVVLSNSTAALVNLSIPRDYHAYTLITLAAGEARVLGTFLQPTNGSNAGWRNVTPDPAPVARPAVVLSRSGSDFQMRWPSETAWDYLPQRSTNLFAWSDLTTNYQVGTGTNMTCRDPGAAGSRRQAFYRLLIRPH